MDEVVTRPRRVVRRSGRSKALSPRVGESYLDFRARAERHGLIEGYAKARVNGDAARWSGLVERFRGGSASRRNAAGSPAKEKIAQSRRVVQHVGRSRGMGRERGSTRTRSAVSDSKPADGDPPGGLAPRRLGAGAAFRFDRFLVVTTPGDLRREARA